MRRHVVSVLAALGLAMTGVGTAHAEQAPEAGAAKAAAGKKICKVTDPKLDELSGIVATDDGFVVINDSSPQNSRERVFFLDDSCKITDQVEYSGKGPFDPEDLILSPNGKTLWIADIGDNDRERETVSVWQMPVDGSRKPKLYRLSYPEGDRRNAEALLLNGDGTPIIVSWEAGKPAALYTPTGALEPGEGDGVPMRKVGEITVPPSTTPGNGLARVGRGTIDGGAVAPGGGKVVLRTYTDALEWTVKGGDVLAALKGKPRVTPLPNEPQGEAITYSPDGKYFYTVSDLQGVTDEVDNFILRYTPVTTTAITKGAAGGSGDDKSGPSWYANLSLDDITYLVGGVGVLGAILVGLGIFGIVRSRKRRALEPPTKGDGPSTPTDPETELLTVGGAAAGRGTGTYGGNGNRPASGPGVYGGGRPPAPQPGVYGGGARPGGQPAGRPGGQPAARPGGQPAGRPGSQPAARPGAQPAARPGAQPAARPGGQPPGRSGGQPPGRSGGQPPGRSGRPVAPPPPPAGRPGPGQPPGRPGPGVYGNPPPPSRNNSAGTPRPGGFFGQGAGHPGEGGRGMQPGMNSYSDLNRHHGRDFDNPGYGRTYRG
ncbi:hypothetical protein [Jidongwangia harbinensis]|uniref:hypothetical protein n=1 Tax=Jidongwangia harbinensis TaxID=2878561 RepID=UPI001CD97680|nr:hypothetical protein [Jidongwangia harbinensis]MCA2215298.1 hypothetical protein [Jidongwangia harbinensis]